MRSLAELCDLVGDTVKSALKGHVHEFRLGVHLESTKDGLINFVVDSELLSLVIRVGLKS